jgi:hypothetical protein
MKHGICACFLVVASMLTACSHGGVTTPTPVPVTAPPSVSFALSGAVLEPGQGPVADVRVTDTASTTSTLTDSRGDFSLTLPSAGSLIHIRFEKDGYEPVELVVTSANMQPRIQKIIRLVAGETVTPPRLAPNDLTYIVGPGEHCSSCRLIRIVVPTTGTLHLRLTWSPPTAANVTLGLWVGGRHVVPTDGSDEADADVPAEAGELIVYVDRVSPSATTDHVPFVLTTSLTE